jgi:ABC-type branched-subunit amino acid transport system ATPase component
LGDRAGVRAAELSTTEQRLLMLATALAADPRVLLLDEPSSAVGGADLPRLAAVIRELRDRGLALLVVEHNVRLVRDVADHVLVLDTGRVVAGGTPGELEL